MENNKNPAQPQTVGEALEQIERILRRMLVLAELSAGDGNVDRAALQRTLEHMRREIDRLASLIESLPES